MRVCSAAGRESDGAGKIDDVDKAVVHPLPASIAAVPDRYGLGTREGLADDLALKSVGDFGD